MFILYNCLIIFCFFLIVCVCCYHLMVNKDVYIMHAQSLYTVSAFLRCGVGLWHFGKISGPCAGDPWMIQHLRKQNLQNLSKYVNLYSLFNKRQQRKGTQNIHSKLLHTDSDITCPEISSDDEQAAWTLGKSKQNSSWHWAATCITGSKQFHEESKQSRATLTDIDCSGMHKAGWECTSFE